MKVEDACICSGKLLSLRISVIWVLLLLVLIGTRHQCRISCQILFFHLNILNIRFICKDRNNGMQWKSMCFFWLLSIVTPYHFLIHTPEADAWCYVADGRYYLRIKPFPYLLFFFRRVKIHEHFCILGVAELNSIESFEL